MSDQMKREFEEWASKVNAAKKQRIDLKSGVDGGFYYCQNTEIIWQAWKASRKALVVELPRSFHDNYGQYVYDEQSTHDALEKAGVTYK